MNKIEFLAYTPYHDDQYILGIIRLRFTVLLGTNADGSPRWGKEVVRYKHVKTKNGDDFFTSGSFGVTECGQKKYLPTNSFDSMSDSEELVEFIKENMQKNYSKFLVSPSAIATAPESNVVSLHGNAQHGGAPSKTDDLPF